MKTSDVGVFVRKMRAARYPSRRQAAKVLKVFRAGRWKPLTPEGLRRIELNQRLPGPSLLDEIIKVWGLTLEEAEELRFAVFAQRQRRDGYEIPSSIDDVGEDREAAVASCTGAIEQELLASFVGKTIDDGLREEIRRVIERHIRAYFR